MARSLWPLLTLTIYICLFTIASARDDRPRRPVRDVSSSSHASNSHAHDYSDGGGDAKSRLDAQILYLLGALPKLISTAVYTIESDLEEKNIKSLSQGYSIIAAGFKDIIGHSLVNNVNLFSPGNANFYLYGFFGSYGFGFGLPLVLGLEDPFRECGVQDYNRLVHKYGLGNGLAHYLGAGHGNSVALDNVLAAQVSEFDLFVKNDLCCVLDKESDYIEAAEVSYALDELIEALNLRIEWAEAQAK